MSVEHINMAVPVERPDRTDSLVAETERQDGQKRALLDGSARIIADFMSWQSSDRRGHAIEAPLKALAKHYAKQLAETVTNPQERRTVRTRTYAEIMELMTLFRDATLLQWLKRKHTLRLLVITLCLTSTGLGITFGVYLAPHLNA